MRRDLLYNPRLLAERLYRASEEFWRGRLVKGAGLCRGELDSLELLLLAEPRKLRTIFDIGAHVGKWTVLAKRLAPGARIEAFEPLPQLKEAFGANTANCRDVTLHNVAVGAANRMVRMNISDDWASSSLLSMTARQESQFSTKIAGTREVREVKLDDYCAENGLPWPELIKLDIQGYEKAALCGATQCLKNARYVITEVSFDHYYQGQCLFHELAGVLNAQHYRVHALSTQTPLGQPLTQTDMLFIRHGEQVPR